MRKKFRKILGCLTLLFLLTSCGGMTNSSEITKLETKETQQEKQQTNKQNVEKTVSQETRQNYTKDHRTKVQQTQTTEKNRNLVTKKGQKKK